MSRFRRITHGIASGYMNLIAGVIYSLASLPLAFHYLSKKEFALWGLMSGISGYLGLIDLGMTAAVSRHLVDFKDDRDGGTYGSLIKTGWIVLLTQSLIVFVVGFLGAPILSRMLAVEADFDREFVLLLRWQCAWLAINIAIKMFSQLLNSHQRMDIVNHNLTSLFALTFAAQWFFFHRGCGVISLVWSLLVSQAANAILMFIACARLGLFPARGCWGKASWSLFREMFSYGKDVFLMALGNQLIVASQTMIITRRLGLETAGIWAAGTRAYTQVWQGISRIIAVSVPALSEMIVRKEKSNLLERFKDVTVLSASVGGFCAVTFAVCNSTFVDLVTHGKVAWELRNDVLLGIWMILLSIVGCHNNLVIATKQIGFMRYIYFLEGLIFVVAAWIASKWGGLSAVIACSIVCTAAFTFSYGLKRSHDYFQIPISEVACDWSLPMFRVICLYAPVAGITRYLTEPLNEYYRLVILCLVALLVGLPIFLFQGLPSKLRNELMTRGSRYLKLSFSRN